MTDTRIPEWWLTDRRILRLSPSAFRTLVMVYVWTVSNRTDGLVELDDVDLIPGADPGDFPELEGRGVVGRADGRLTLTDSGPDPDQPPRTRGTGQRPAPRAGQESAPAGGQESSPPARADSPPGSSPGIVPGTAQEGQEGQEGQAGSTATTYGTARPAAISDWPDLTSYCDTCGHSHRDRECATERTTA